jgi:hypothetical protein
VNRVALRCTMDSRRWHLERLTGAWPAGTAEPRSSPWVGEKERSFGGPHGWQFGAMEQRDGPDSDAQGQQLVMLIEGDVQARRS